LRLAIPDGRSGVCCDCESERGAAKRYSRAVGTRDGASGDSESNWSIGYGRPYEVDGCPTRTGAVVRHAARHCAWSADAPPGIRRQGDSDARWLHQPPPACPFKRGVPTGRDRLPDFAGGSTSMGSGPTSLATRLPERGRVRNCSS
jgi:hypothetical protein